MDGTGDAESFRVWARGPGPLPKEGEEANAFHYLLSLALESDCSSKPEIYTPIPSPSNSLCFVYPPSPPPSMSSSSTTACSRSPSPATPATPESSDHVDTVVTHEDLAAWCHNLSPAGFLIGDESHFTDSLKKRKAPRPVDLEESPGDDSLAE